MNVKLTTSLTSPSARSGLQMCEKCGLVVNGSACHELSMAGVLLQE